MQLKYLTDYHITSKRVMLRADMNVPIKGGKVENEERIDRSLKTIKFILDQGGKLTLVTHLGRPQESDQVQEEFSLRPIAECLEKKLNRPIVIEESLHALNSSKAELAMLENIRFFDGEKRNSPQLAKELAKNCDLFVNDAFATSHRAHASTVGVVDFVNEACAGFLIKEELEALENFDKAKRPIVGVLGGAKISTKLSLISSLAKKVDFLILGGGLANTCLGAQGKEIGSSLTEMGMYQEVKAFVDNEKILLPSKVLVGKDKRSKVREKDVNNLTEEDCIFDVSPDFFISLADIFNKAGTIVWNGPMGLFEEDKFSHGTLEVAKQIANSNAYSIVGGGDTISAATKAGILDSINYLSTAGGAFLEYLEGKSLPALLALKKKALESPKDGA